MSGQSIGAPAAAALASAAYGALLVCVQGFVALWSGSAPIAVQGVGAVPVMLAGLVAVAVLFCALLRALRAQRPAYTTAIPVALLTALAHLVALSALSAAFGSDPAAALAAAGASVTGWSSASVTVLAAVCAWGGVALRRTEADRPRWPWEREGE